MDRSEVHDEVHPTAESAASGPVSLRYKVEAAVFFTAMAFFRALGLDRASAVGGFIGRNFFYNFRGVMRRARDNLRAAFPEMPEAERDAIVREMCDNLGRTVAEYAHLDKFSIRGADPRIEMINTDIADRALASGKAVIFFSGHFANWELMPFAGTQLGFEGGEVYRPQNNPIVDRWLVEQRARNGTPIQISKGAKGTRQIFTLLRRRKAIFLLADQKTNEGISVPFFKREAMTTPVPAMLAFKLDAILLPASSERLSGSRFRTTIHPPIEFTPTGVRDRDVYALTCAINDAVEKCVRARPSQWLWIHRRWPTSREQDQVRGKRALRTLGDASAPV